MHIVYIGSYIPERKSLLENFKEKKLAKLQNYLYIMVTLYYGHATKIKLPVLFFSTDKRY